MLDWNSAFTWFYNSFTKHCIYGAKYLNVMRLHGKVPFMLLFVGLEARQLLMLFAPIYNWRGIKSWSVYIISKQTE
jgi:hypothetical protein